MSEHRPVTQACDPLSLAPRGVCVCVCVCACACGAGAGQRRPTSLDSGRAGTGRRSWTSSPSRSCRVARSVVRNPLATARFAHPRAAPFLRPCVPCRLLLPACACLLHCCVSHTRTLLLPPLASACVCVCVCVRARARASLRGRSVRRCAATCDWNAASATSSSPRRLTACATRSAVLRVRAFRASRCVHVRMHARARVYTGETSLSLPPPSSSPRAHNPHLSSSRDPSRSDLPCLCVCGRGAGVAGAGLAGIAKA